MSFFVPRTALPGHEWPSIPPKGKRLMLSLLFQLEQTQWWSPEDIRAHQMRQLSKVMEYANEQSPYFKLLFVKKGIKPGPDMAEEHWDKLPVLPRTTLQEHGDKVYCQSVPKDMQPTGQVNTSGSSGRPVRVVKTAINQLFYFTLTMREAIWAKRDIRRTLATIRIPVNAKGAPMPDAKEQDTWGSNLDTIFPTGKAGMLDVRNTLADQMAWLLAFNPSYLLTYPSNAVGLAQYALDHNIKLPNLREVSTLSETITQPQRDMIKETFGVPVTDMYSAQEVGYMALQAPGHEHYLVQSESVLVEIIREDGTPCEEGEVGRIVVTDLHNYATPMLRYDIGDLAEVGGACPTGRGLPVLKRILGRVRNLVTTPDGRRFWPGLADVRYKEVLPVKQFQFVQTTLEDIEIRMVVPRDVTEAEENRLRELILERIGYPFNLTFNYMDEIPRLPNGKFEDFRSELTPDQVAAAVEKGKSSEGKTLRAQTTGKAGETARMKKASASKTAQSKRRGKKKR